MTLVLVWALAAPTLPAADGGGFFSGLTGPYQPFQTAPISLDDSGRLDSLIRAGQLYLSLQDAIALALENNLDVEYMRYGFRMADISFDLAKAGGGSRGVSTRVQRGVSSAASQAVGGFAESAVGGAGAAVSGGTTQLDPVITASAGWGHISSPQTNTVTTGGRTAIAYESTYMNYGVGKQFVTGTGVELSWSSSSLLSNNPQNNFNPSTSADVGLTFSQSLLNGFGASYRRSIQLAQNRLDVTDLVFRQQVIETVTTIVRLYWDLVSYGEAVRVNRQALELAEQLLRDNQVRVRAGALAPVDVINSEAQVARRRQDVALSEGRLIQQEKILKNQLSRSGLDNPLLALVRIVPTDRLEVPAVESIQPVQDLVATAVENRPDMLQTDIEIEDTKIGLKASADSLRPSLSVYASLQNTALAGEVNELRVADSGIDPFFIGGYGTAFGQLLRRNFPNYTFGFSLQVPLRNRTARANYAIDSLQLRQQELNRRRQVNSLRVEVENALVAVEQARIRYEAAVEERSLREQVLDAEEKRYTLGVSQAFFVIQYQTELVTAQSAEVTALTEYVKAKVDLDRVTGQTLEAFNISIDEARGGRMSAAPSPLPLEQP